MFVVTLNDAIGFGAIALAAVILVLFVGFCWLRAVICDIKTRITARFKKEASDE